VHPTDQVSGLFRAPKSRNGWKRRFDRAGRVPEQGLVTAMKSRFTRIIVTLSTVAMIAVAGGASLRVF
jgi:hypothetical protein